MLITLKGISKSFGSEEVLHDIDLTITRGSSETVPGLKLNKMKRGKKFAKAIIPNDDY